jgi:glycosyltransferase involved in cell wall biosynthesis
MRVAAVIPALNEEQGIARVLPAIPRDLVAEVVVVDNGSTDRTAEVARTLGATVLSEPRRGYGAACLKGLAHLAHDPPEVVVFLDGDGSDRPEELAALLRPITREGADLVIGSRLRGRREPGAMLPHSYWGNVFCCAVINRLHGTRFTDLGPLRAVTWAGLEALRMADRDYGWTAEMQIKAARRGLKVVEVPVSYRCRLGRSKVSGTLRGTLGAATKILWMAVRLRFWRPQARRAAR